MRREEKEKPQPCSLKKGDHKHSKLDKMRQQWNMLQVKEQGKDQINQDQINEEEKRTLPEKEFRVMIVKMIQNFRKRVETQT